MTTVHLLRAGLPLCGFSDRIPAAWPPGHRWISAEEAPRADVMLMQHPDAKLCDACRNAVNPKPEEAAR